VKSKPLDGEDNGCMGTKGPSNLLTTVSTLFDIFNRRVSWRSHH